MAVAENLDLDMAGFVDQSLGVERLAAEGAFRLGPATGEGVGDFLWAAHGAHTAAAAAGDRLQHDRRAESFEERPCLVRAAHGGAFDDRRADSARRSRAQESCRRRGRASRAKARRRSCPTPRPRGRRRRFRRESRNRDGWRRSPSPSPARSFARRRDRLLRRRAPTRALRRPCAGAARKHRPPNRPPRWRSRDRRPRGRCG